MVVATLSVIDKQSACLADGAWVARVLQTIWPLTVVEGAESDRRDAEAACQVIALLANKVCD